jgi:hypothetical protein
MVLRKRLKHRWKAADRDGEIAVRWHRHENQNDDRMEKHPQLPMKKMMQKRKLMLDWMRKP